LEKGDKIFRMKSVLGNRTKKSQTAPASAPEPSTPPKFTPRGGGKKRILIAVQEGKIDFASMSSEASKELNELLHTPDVQAQFNIGPLRDRFDPEHCKRIYEALGIMFMGAAKFLFKWPEVALPHLIYTEKEKEELAEPTASVLDEFAPKWLKEHQAVAALALVFGAITQNKFRAASAAALEWKRSQAGLQVPPRPATDAAGKSTIPLPVVDDKFRADLHTDMRRAGIKVPINTAPAPTPAENVNLGPAGGASL
jgi:hypothetical protein